MPEKLIHLPPKGRVVFVGDTHGDLEATQTVLQWYRREETVLVFLGDYVDRGLKSKENLDLVIHLWETDPRHVIPLQGNHEGYFVRRYSPAYFWMSLDAQEFEYYKQKVSEFPLAVSVGSILALHGAVPNLETLADFETIRIGDSHWLTLTWGDFSEQQTAGGNRNRVYTKDYFDRIMQKLGKSLLIRGHDPEAKVAIYDGRCVTLSTTIVFGPRKIAIADFTKRPKIAAAGDLEIVDIDQLTAIIGETKRPLRKER
ncbi:MAG: serine/threonine protein phosphatase [Thermoguttaceae bacterium]|nr:serine/threonine protein phosphatase [Thermoguttaceae bacterium]MDW8037374.1 metallophosphoesterase family protein [Thermoguttaceae bacterium]